MELLYTSSREAAERIAERPLAFLPLAAFYDRGGLPLGAWDALARHFAAALATECGGFALPALPYSSVPGGLAAAGEISIPHAAFRNYLEAVVDEARANDLRPVIVSAVPSDDGLPYVISREYFERTGYPLPWVDVPALVWRTDVPYLPAGDARLPAVLLAAVHARYGPQAAVSLQQRFRRARRQPQPAAPPQAAVSMPIPRRQPPLPIPQRVSRSAGERLLRELARRFAAEVPPALAAYSHYLAGRKSFRRPMKGFPVWAG